MKLESKEINQRASENYAVFSQFLNVEEEAWRSAVLELYLEKLGHNPQKLWEEYPQEHCCGKHENEYDSDHEENDCWCCNGECVWCN